MHHKVNVPCWLPLPENKLGSLRDHYNQKSIRQSPWKPGKGSWLLGYTEGFRTVEAEASIWNNMIWTAPWRSHFGVCSDIPTDFLEPTRHQASRKYETGMPSPVASQELWVVQIGPGKVYVRVLAWGAYTVWEVPLFSGSLLLVSLLVSQWAKVSQFSTVSLHLRVVAYSPWGTGGKKKEIAAFY